MLLLLLCCGTVRGASLAEATAFLMEARGIAVEPETSYADLLHNRRYIADRELVHTALKHGILIPDGYVLDMDGMDLLPLLKGILWQCLADTQKKLVTGSLSALKQQQITFSDETIYLTESFSPLDLQKRESYTAVTDLQNRAIYVWNARQGLTQPALYCGTAYWLEDGMLILKNAQRRQSSGWNRLDEPYTTVDVSTLRLHAADFMRTYMDRTVFMLVDDSDRPVGNLLVVEK